MTRIAKWIAAACPNVGYGLTVVATLYLGNIGLLLATLPHAEVMAMSHLMDVLAFSIIGSLALIFSGLNLSRIRPLHDRSAMLWIWLLGLPVARRFAELALAVRWEQSMIVEAALLSAAIVIVVMSAGRLEPEQAP